MNAPAAPAAGPEQGNGRAGTLASVARGARLTRDKLMLVALATAIAHLGLLMNSAPVIIGAMLISPLLGPIVGLGFGFAVFEGALVRRSLQSLAAMAATAIALACVLTLLSPIRDVTPEIAARVRPSLLDLLIAVAGGIAGAYAVIRRTMIELVGVAIATSLVPPLAVVGFAIATARSDFAVGALLLFVTNTTAIALMATATARIAHFGHMLSPRQTWAQSGGILALLAVLAVPLGLRLSAIVHDASAQASLRASLQDMAGEDARIDRLEITLSGDPARVDALVIEPRFVPQLEPRFLAEAAKVLGRPVDGAVLQLRSGSAEAEAARAAESRKAADDVARAASAARLRAALVAVVNGGGAVTVDPAARRAIVVRPQGAPSLPVPTLAALRAAFPDWTIDQASVARGVPGALVAEGVNPPGSSTAPD